MEGESQTEDSSSSSYLTNFIKIIRNASLNPIFLNNLTQNLIQFPQIQACFDSETHQNFQKDAYIQNDNNFQQENSNPNAKKLLHIEKIVSNDEETSVGSHCGESELLDEGKLEILKKNNKKLIKFEEIIDKLFTKLSLQNLDEIKTICLDVLKLIVPVLTDHFKNKPFEAVAAAIVVFSCRNANYPITLKEIVAATCEQGKDLTKMINKCIFSLKSVLPEKEFMMKILNPEEMAKKISKKLNLNEKMMKCVSELIKIIESKNYVKGKHPNTVAACAIKIATILLWDDKNGICFEKLAETANLNKITLKNTYRELYLHSEGIINEIKKMFEVSIKELPNL